MPAETLVELQAVGRQFGNVAAIQNLTIMVNRGELFGVIGPDGAGKTTLMRMIAAVLNPSQGTITVGGNDTVAAAEAVKTMTGYMPQRFGLYADLSVQENLAFAADVFGITGKLRRERMAQLYTFSQLGPFKARPAGLLSGGMKKKLGLATALIHQPELLLLDEPTTGVDPLARRGFWDLLSNLHANGTTTIVTTPYMDEAERCSRVVLLYEGQIIACDEPAAIKARVLGEVVTLEAKDMRAARRVLEEVKSILDLQPYGNRLNIIYDAEEAGAIDHIRTALEDANIAITSLKSVPMRMEEAFTYLVNQHRLQETV
ncbi:MAG: ABC transporter ATP-binding protein [Chloroflexi bacterium]|nr:ABC transporter ATP-binding protein [Chloroflexota bacterium]